MISSKQLRSDALRLGVGVRGWKQEEVKNPIVAFTLKFLKC